MKIKILFVIWSLETGGAERFLVGLLRHINLDDFEPAVCCLNWKGAWAPSVEARGIPVMALNKRDKFDPKAFKRLRTIIREGEFQIVNTHLWGADVQGRVAAIFEKVPCIVSTAQNVDVWKKWHHRLTDRMLGKKTHCVIAVSQAVKKYYHEVVGLPHEKIRMIPNAVDCSVYDDAGDTEYLYQEFQIERESFVLACVGRLSEQKGHCYLLRSLADLKENIPQLRVLIVGDGELAESLRLTAQDLGVGSMVRFVGRRDDIPQILKFSKALVLPSIFEGLPLCVLEAMASSRPVIATRAGGTAELAVDGQTALIVPSRDVKALTGAIRDLGNLPDQGLEMGRQGRIVVEEKFSILKITKETESLFKELIGV